MTTPNCPKCDDQGTIVVDTVDRVEVWGHIWDVPEYGYCDCPAGQALARREEEYFAYDSHWSDEWDGRIDRDGSLPTDAEVDLP